ncbi:MAG: hypothetical protein ABIW76_06575 [Fibrobacteria bacterium]
MKPYFTFLTGMLLTSLYAQNTSNPIVLNIRGGENTGGLATGNNNELSSFSDYSKAELNRGWGEFADLLTKTGFDPQEIREGKLKTGCEVQISIPCSDPIDFAGMDLAKYSVIIMGSNNSRYDKSAVDAVMRYIEQGGGILFMSDGNFGRDYRAAPWSDQPFLDRFGLIMDQDNGYYPIKKSGGDFLIPEHPLLKGVDEFNGEGVNPISFSKKIEGIKVEIIAKAKMQVRRNVNSDGTPIGNSNQGKGPLTDANNNDASLISAEYGKGRAVFIYDRNCFFNDGAKTSSMAQVNNKQLALNIMEWVKRKSSVSNRLKTDHWVSKNSGPLVHPLFNAKGQYSGTNKVTDMHTPPNRVQLFLNGLGRQ